MNEQQSTVRALVERGESLASLGWNIVDAHAHLGPTGGFYIPTPDATTMVEMMDRLGIAITGISAHLGLVCDYIRGNELTAEAVQRFPQRFFGYVTPNPHYGEEAIRELERGLDELGLQAIKLHPSLHNYAVDAPICEPIWRFAEERKALVLIHTWVGDARCHPGLFGKLAKAYPHVRFLLGHSGGPIEGKQEAIAVAQEHENIYLEICTSLLFGSEVEEMVSKVGAERVVFGTDVPWLDPRFVLGKLAYSNLSDEQLRLILSENIRRLLSLP